MILVKLEQNMKAWPRIDVRLLGIVIFARLIHIWKVLFPIDAILFGIVILDKLEQEEKKKAKCSIDVDTVWHCNAC